MFCRKPLYRGPVVEQPGAVGGVGGSAEDVHHEKVLDVVRPAPLRLQLVNVVPAKKNQIVNCVLKVNPVQFIRGLLLYNGPILREYDENVIV